MFGSKKNAASLDSGIKDLQKRLKAAQQASNAKRISERNCVDLVQKLISSGQIKLFHTSNGKEWVTPDRLDQEIREALANSGGRLDITELPGKVGVDIGHCELRVEHLCKKDESLQRLHNDLINNQFLKYVAMEVEESLQEEGCIAVSDLATRYTLPASFIKDRVLSLIDVDSLVVRQNSIHTQTHATRVEARVRGALRGSTQPVSLGQLAGRHGLEADMVAAAVQQLISAGDILGKLQAGTFTPRSYVDAQSSRVDSFFSSNQYLPLNLLRSVGLEVKDWARTNQVEGVSLKTAFLAAQLVESARSSISEALAADTWTDVQLLLPPSLTSEDAAELLRHLADRKQLPTNAVILNRIIMSNNFVKGIASNFDSEMKLVAQRLMATQTATRSGKKSNAGGGGGGAVDDGGTSKKKGKRGARSKKGRGEDDDDDDGDKDVAARGTGSGGSNRETLLEDNVIADKLMDEFPDIPEEVHEELIGQLQPLLAAMVAEEQRVLQAELEAKQQAQFEASAKLVQERHVPLVVGLRALEAAGLQESPLFQHLLREVLMEPVHQLLAFRLQEVAGTGMEVTAANRKQCLDKLQAAGGLTEELSKLASILSKGKDAKDAKEPKDAQEGKSASKKKKGEKESKDRDGKGEADSFEGLAEIAELYQISARDCHIVCKKVEKKNKAVIQELRSSLREQVKEIPSSDALQVCWVGLQLALAEEGISGLLFPSEIWALRLVAQRLSKEQLRTQALSLCQSLETPSESDTLEEDINKWKERLLGSDE